MYTVPRLSSQFCLFTHNLGRDTHMHSLYSQYCWYWLKPGGLLLPMLGPAQCYSMTSNSLFQGDIIKSAVGPQMKWSRFFLLHNHIDLASSPTLQHWKVGKGLGTRLIYLVNASTSQLQCSTVQLVSHAVGHAHWGPFSVCVRTGAYVVINFRGGKFSWLPSRPQK